MQASVGIRLSFVTLLAVSVFAAEPALKTVTVKGYVLD